MIPMVGVSISFSYGHRLQYHTGKCINIHGHNGVLKLTVNANVFDTRQGMTADFGAVKQIARDWIDLHWDHALLLQKSDPVVDVLAETDLKLKVFLMDLPPTAEIMVEEVSKAINRQLPGSLYVHKARFYETPTSWADWECQ